MDLEQQVPNVSILHFVGAKDDGNGGDQYSCKMCKAPVQSPPPTNQHQYSALLSSTRFAQSGGLMSSK